MSIAVLPGWSEGFGMIGMDSAVMEERAEEAARFLSGLASPHRLRILCQLADGEKNVTQLMEATGIAQTSMSQHLAKLKDEGLVSFRREHRILFYSICNPMVLEIMTIMYSHFCGRDAK